MSESSVALAVTASETRGDRFERRVARWKKDASSLIYQVRILPLILRHPLVPWRAKVAAACALAYLLSPVQLIPTFIPVIGQLDDLAVLFAGMRAIRKLTPPNVLAECETKARSASVIGYIEKLVKCHAPK
jgi:uncharacterized membrane protein YkvA (DUF1232 family)